MVNPKKKGKLFFRLLFILFLSITLAFYAYCGGGSDNGNSDEEQAMSNFSQLVEELSFLEFPPSPAELTDLEVTLGYLNSIDRLEQAAKAQMEAGNYPDALKILTAQMQLESNNVDLKTNIVECLEELYANAANYQESMILLYRMLAMDYSNSIVSDNIADLTHTIRKATRRSGYGYALMDFNDGFNLFDENRYEESLEKFESAFEKAPTDYFFQSTLGLMYQNFGFPEKALETLSSLDFENNPDPISQAAIAQINWARNHLKDNILPEEGDSAHNKILYATALIYTGDIGQGLSILTSLLNKGIENTDYKKFALHLMGLALVRQGKHLKALPYYDQLIDMYTDEIGHTDQVYFIKYKVQLEDQRSIEVIAQKFRTDSQWISAVNYLDHPDYVREYQILLIPRIRGNRPFIMPAKGVINSLFGIRLDPFAASWRMHSGVDIKTDEGVKAIAAGEGVVTYAGITTGGGNTVYLDHGRGIESRYMHGDDLLVRWGDQLEQGDDVFHTGNTGRSVARHLHYEVRLLDKALDPMDFF